MSTILFGSISTLADTSELQREAFNNAFAEHGLDWTWDRAQYRELLTGNGGRARIAAYAQERGQDVDAGAVHDTKSKLFQQSLTSAPLTPRPGVAETISAARAGGHQLGFVTTTSRANIASLFDALAGARISADDFDVVLDSSDVDAPKPDRAAYDVALQRLGVEASSCVAIEDNVGGVAAAKSAGIACVAFPNANTEAHDFSDADDIVQRLDLSDLLGVIG